MSVANLSHPVNISASSRMIEVSSQGIVLDRDIILDVDLPPSRSAILFAVEQRDESDSHAILTAFTPSREHFAVKDRPSQEITTTLEFIFIGMNERC